MHLTSSANSIMQVISLQPWDMGEDDQAPEPKFEYGQVAVTGILSVHAQQVCEGTVYIHNCNLFTNII
jgi:hypothetical protein